MFLFVCAGLIAILLAFLSQRKGQNKLLYVALFIVAFIMGFQDDIGSDYSSYVSKFNEIKNGLVEFALIRENRESQTESGWYLLNYIFSMVFSRYQAVSFFISCLLCYTIKRLLDYVRPCWRWVAIAYFYFYNMQFFMSGQRQSAAIVFLTLGIVCMIEKRWKYAILLVLVSLSFHDSAVLGVVFLPFLLIKSEEGMVIKRPRLLCVILIALFFFSYFGQNVFQNYFNMFGMVFASNRDMLSGYLDEMATNEYSFLNMLMRFIFFGGFVYAYVFSEYRGNYFLLYAIIMIPLSIVLGTSNLVRVSFYIVLFTLPSICMVIDSLKKQNLIQILYIAFVLYFSYRMFSNSLLDSQYHNYLNYHTILF